jgi:hypothetical protein
MCVTEGRVSFFRCCSETRLFENKMSKGILIHHPSSGEISDFYDEKMTIAVACHGIRVCFGLSGGSLKCNGVTISGDALLSTLQGELTFVHGRCGELATDHPHATPIESVETLQNVVRNRTVETATALLERNLVLPEFDASALAGLLAAYQGGNI